MRDINDSEVADRARNKNSLGITARRRVGNMNKALMLASLIVAASIPSTSFAQVVTHSGDQLVANGVSPTPAVGLLVEAVGTQAIQFGVDYSSGNVEGIFIDGGTHALCGINSVGTCNLLTAVDGRIVVLGTTNQGFTNFINLIAGDSDPGGLTLSVFDQSGTLLQTATGAGFLGPFSITRSAFDIASFSIGGNDSFGVQSVSIETPMAAVRQVAAVPEPATWAMMLIGFGSIGFSLRRRPKFGHKIQIA